MSIDTYVFVYFCRINDSVPWNKVAYVNKTLAVLSGNQSLKAVEEKEKFVTETLQMESKR